MAAHDEQVHPTDPLDLAGCDREPIHIPGSIQPHGALFLIEPEHGRILQAAVGEVRLGASGGDYEGRRLADLLPAAGAAMVEALLEGRRSRGLAHLGRVEDEDGAYHVIAHPVPAGIIVELEATAQHEPGSFDEFYPYVRDFLEEVQNADTIDEIGVLAARQVRRITGLDRAMVYRFDSEWNGEVIAEDRNDRLPSYLGLRFPASDIPAQARELYRLNRLRLIADAVYEPVPILPPRPEPVDLSLSVLRSVSPVHLEYMRNMGTMASMSISLLRDGDLWGLISCHNRDPARVSYPARAACDFIGQVLSMQIAAKEGAAGAERRQRLRQVQIRLLARMSAAENFVSGLASQAEDMMALAGATGAAIVWGGQCVRVGDAPEQDAILALTDWLGRERNQDLFVTDSLASLLPGAESSKDVASGVLAISISQIYKSFVLWFRPEAVRTVSWGGDPNKRAERDPGGLRLHPRKSFEAWRETVRLRSQPWGAAEIDAVAELRTAIVDIVLRNAEETAALSERLTISNKELEAFSYSVSHDLRAPFRHIVGYAQLLKKFEGEKLSERGNRYIDTIVESAISAGTLVDDLLSFSQMGRAALTPVQIDMNALVEDVKRGLVVEGADGVEWRISDLPTARADPLMVRLAFQNLIDNAIKFSRGRNPAIVEIGAAEEADRTIYHVRDNGTGFDMAYVGKLFGVFQRLHRVEEFEGTGIGLANVKRVAERHGGSVWAEGEVDGGATFFFSLPKTRVE